MDDAWQSQAPREETVTHKRQFTGVTKPYGHITVDSFLGGPLQGWGRVGFPLCPTMRNSSDYMTNE